MGISIPSAEEYEASRSGSSEFSLMPEDDYIVEIKDIEIKANQVDIFNKNADGSQIVRDTLLVRLRPISFLNGDELVDQDGEEVGNDRLFFAFIDPTHVGLVPVPAKARKFFAAALGLSVEDRIDIENYADLVGKRIVVTVIHKNGKHNVTDFRVVRQRAARSKKADADVATAAASKISDADAATVANAAKEIFTDDLPF